MHCLFTRRFSSLGISKQLLSDRGVLHQLQVHGFRRNLLALRGVKPHPDGSWHLGRPTNTRGQDLSADAVKGCILHQASETDTQPWYELGQLRIRRRINCCRC